MSAADLDILKAVRRRPPAARVDLARHLGVEADQELSLALSRLVTQKLLCRISMAGPGSATNWVYTLSDEGRRMLDEAETAPAGPPPKSATPPPSTNPATTKKAPDMTAPQKPEGNRRDRVLAILRAEPDSLASAIATSLAVPVDVINRDLFALKKKGLVVSTGDKKPHGFRIRKSPVVPGTRIPVRTIRQFADAGYTVEQIMKEYPDISAKDIAAALKRRPSATKAAKPSRAAREAPGPAVGVPGTRFRVALTSNRTLLLQRPESREEVELQPHEIQVLTGFLRDIDNAAQLLG